MEAEKQPQPSKDWQALKDKFDALSEQKKDLYKPDFKNVLKTLYEIDSSQRDIYNTKGWNIEDNLPDEADNGKLQKALQKAGFAYDEAFCRAFMDYANKAQHHRYKQIASMLSNIDNDNVVDDIVEYVRSEVENNGELIGGKGFISYVLWHLQKGTELSIWARGNKWLEEERAGNVFEKLILLMLEQSEVEESRHSKAAETCKNTKPQQKLTITKQTEPSTERAKEYFKKAVDAGYMDKTDTGYKWILGNRGSKARLAYFLMQVYNPDNTKQIPYKALEALFGVTRLDSSYSAMLTVSKPQNWRQQIDKLFEE